MPRDANDFIITNVRCSKCGASFSPWKSDIKKMGSIEYVLCSCGAQTTLDFSPTNHEARVTSLSLANPKDAFGDKKVPLHLVASSPLARLAMVMKLGAQKYGSYNWREKEVRLTVYLAAAERHLRAILDGETIDQESGQPHAMHVAACMFIIQDASDIGKLVDDRPPPGNFPAIAKELEQ